MKDFEKMMEELKRNLSGLDETIEKQVSAAFEEMGKSFKIYKDFYDHENGSQTSGSRNAKHKDCRHGSGGRNHGPFTFTFSDSHGKSFEGADEFVKMAPYLDEESLHELTVEFCESDLECNMMEILPYLEEEDVALILEKVEEREEFKGLRAEDLFPYLDDASIDELFMKKFSQGKVDENMFSFVSDECWHKIVMKYCEDENSKIDIDAIYPFLNDGDLNLLFRNFLKRRKK